MLLDLIARLVIHLRAGRRREHSGRPVALDEAGDRIGEDKVEFRWIPGRRG